MHDIELLFALLAVAVAAVWLARALGVPYPIFLVLAGVGVGLVPGLSEIEVEPEVIFLVFLPPLLHAAGWLSSPSHLKTHAAAVGSLAIGLVFATTAVVAVDRPRGHPRRDVGGRVRPRRDRVRHRHRRRHCGVPPHRRPGADLRRRRGREPGQRRLGARAGQDRDGRRGGRGRSRSARPPSSCCSSARVAHCSASPSAWVARQVRRRVDDDLIDIAVTLLTPYLCFVGAEELEVSGVLAAVVERPLPRRAPGPRLLGRHAAEGVLVLGGARLPARVAAVHHHRPADPDACSRR